ncbi:type VI secretion system baseplate subunit TssF [Fulvimarina sp. MAC8]|uniref:type VI secretion system baseplate subunit TssF n=1 Tax=Fulvimarina sp. MAC8 TaxID=3162874 RepID=UPI0032F04101
MAEGFLRRYADELDALRGRAGRFARAFPKIAGRLRLTGEFADDPHVERLVQSFAYSAARIRQKLDDEFPELTDGLLETLYPHYLAPIPSMSIVRFSPSPGLADLRLLTRHSELRCEPLRGEQCRFRTTQDVVVAPVELTAASLGGQPLDAPVTPHQGAAACLRLSLTLPPGSGGPKELGLDRLRLHLAAPWRQSSALAELLFGHTLGIAIARHSSDPSPMLLPASKLTPVGFTPEEGMLPYPATSFAGYRHLTELFALPQKFLFVDIEGLAGWEEDKLEIFVYLDRTDAGLERSVTRNDIVLNAAPVVNLFQQRCEPITLDGTRTEYRLLPDSRRHATREIYSVDSVSINERNGASHPSQPFFGRRRAHASSVFWQISRRFDDDDATSDVDIAFVDESRRMTGALDAVASVEALCLNRDLPAQLPYGGGHPRLELVDNNDGIAAVDALMPPTAAIRLDDQPGRDWRLTSHLNLNHLSLSDRSGGALRDLLRLYAFRDTPETRQLIEAIVALETRQGTARIDSLGMVPGTEIDLTFDPAMIDRPSAYLFGLVLERFFGLYATINTYTRLTVRLRGHSRPIASFAARAAERPLI